MDIDADFLIRLVGLPAVLEQHATLEAGLKELAARTAAQLRCAGCSIMLLEQLEADKPAKLRVYANAGELPQAAYRTSQALGEGIAGYVAETGQPLLIDDLSRSPWAKAARQPEDKQGSLMSAPILVGSKVIGVINAKHPIDGRPFSQQDLDSLSLFARFVGQSIQVVQLQNLLRSRFLQQAIAAEPSSAAPLSPDPSRLARIVAKSFYRELTKAGFSPRDIISTATEVIGLLHEHLNRHKKRLERS